MKQYLTFSTTSLCFLCLFTACSNNGTQKVEPSKDSTSVFDLAAAKKMVEQKDEEWAKAIAAPDSAAMLHHFTTDATILPPNSEPIKGTAAISSFISQVLKFGIKSYQDSIVEFNGNNENLIEVGNYKMGDSKGNTLDKGKYIAIWKKEEGEWKIKTDMFSSNIPLPVTKK